jgi:diaminopropionate ammonia-lyase
MPTIRWIQNRLCKTSDRHRDIMAPAAVDAARRFHESFPPYAPTPLAGLASMARHLGVGGIWVKDESHRFGLDSFKVLGGSFAIGRYVADRLGCSIDAVDFALLSSDALRRQLGPITFFTATDGNHGRGVAWAAAQLNQKAVVLMPEKTSQSRFDSIAALGAKVSIEPLNYDGCVKKAAELAGAAPGGVVMQDTAWEGYEEIPSWIMQGYGTLIAEALDQMAQSGAGRPTHVLVQAGVGSLAAAVQGYLLWRFPDNPPRVAVVECHAADCFFLSARAGDTSSRAVTGALDSIMAGLCCGQASPIAWVLLRNHAHAFVSCPDWVSAVGMRMLASPLPGDAQVVSGESGAVGMGLLAAACTREEYRPLRDMLGIDGSSQVLLLSTEGDTDPARWRSIVWEGAWPAPPGDRGGRPADRQGA